MSDLWHCFFPQATNIRVAIDTMGMSEGSRKETEVGIKYWWVPQNTWDYHMANHNSTSVYLHAITTLVLYFLKMSMLSIFMTSLFPQTYHQHSSYRVLFPTIDHFLLVVIVWCVRMHAHIWVLVHVCICIVRPEFNVGWHLQSLSTLLFETVSLSELKGHWLDWLIDQKTPEILDVHEPYSWP